MNASKNTSNVAPKTLGHFFDRARTAIDNGTFGPPLFSTWNAIFIAFALLGFAPVALVDILRAAQEADVVAPFAIWGLVLALIPVLSCFVAWRWLRDRPHALYALFYGVEAPLMLIAAVRLFVLRDMPAHATMIYAAALVGLATLTSEILFGRKETAPRPILAARVAGLTVLTITGIYVAVWVAFLAVPIAWMYLTFVGDLLGELSRTISRFSFASLVDAPFGELMFIVLVTPLFIFTATLFIASPVLVPALYVRRWRHAAHSLAARTTRAVPVGIAVVVAAAWVGLYVISARQPQHAAFAMLEGVEASGPASAEARQTLALHEAEIKAGLLNAYLARYRYAGVSGVYRQIEQIYESSFGRANTYEEVLSAYDRIARPLLYEPVHPVTGESRAEEDPARAAQLYAAFYDTSIAEAELDAVRDAVRSTWQPEQAAANLSDIEDRDVRIESQTLTIEAAGDIASIELMETYRNRTLTEKEVFYYLTLPESAAVTGLWLGASPDKSQADTFRVSTRGAAQEDYMEQRRINVDPALIEQIGPRQYRLRIFPIPQRRSEIQSEGVTVQEMNEGDPLHLWLRVQVLASPDGGFPLPSLSERRNVYWDGRTERSLAGGSVEWADDEWLPAEIPASDYGGPRVHRADFEGGQSVVAVPASHNTGVAGGVEGAVGTVGTDEGGAGIGRSGDVVARAVSLPVDGRIAVVVDRSRSLGEVENALFESLAELRALVADGPSGSELAAAAVVAEDSASNVAEDSAADIADDSAVDVEVDDPDDAQPDDAQPGVDQSLEVDVVLTSSPVRGEPPRIVPFGSLSNSDLTFFGGQTPAELLGQFDMLREEEAYDVILVLTDAGAFTTQADVPSFPDLGAPLWMVHVGGAFPPGYPDALLEAMRSSGGGASGSVTEALSRSFAEDGELYRRLPVARRRWSNRRTPCAERRRRFRLRASGGAHVDPPCGARCPRRPSRK